MKTNRRFRAAFWAIAVSCGTLFLGLVFSTPALADTFTYSYLGNDFTFFQTGYSCPPECRLSGSFTVNTPLGDNLSDAWVDPTSFKLTDGVTTWTDENALPVNTVFMFSTDAGGNITAWNVGATIDYAWWWWSDNLVGFYPTDSTMYCPPTGNCNEAADENPGTWKVTSTPTPEPSTLLLLATNLLGCGWAANVRRRGRR